MSLALSVRNLSKTYIISKEQEKHNTLAETVLGKIRNPASIFRKETETFHALKDLSFDIHQGDVVGIIGRNGAGKSTLLKILSRITEPTTGEIDLYGRVGSLLEVGTGFHPELTGRENIYLNGHILGMQRHEIDKQFDAIVDFAGVEKFLDTPVKRYSSGMYVRLAFAVAAHLRCEILVVDEVLAVGDAEFQKKCLGKMKDVAQGGRTVLFVSHNMAAVQNLCNKCILLERGHLCSINDTASVIQRYHKSYRTGTDLSQALRPAWAVPWICKAQLKNSRGEATHRFGLGEHLTIEVEIQGPDNAVIRNVGLGVLFHHHSLGILGGLNNRMLDQWPVQHPVKSGKLQFTIEHFPGLQGIYSIDLFLADGQVDVDMITSAIEFEIDDSDIYGTGKPPMRGIGAIFLNGNFRASSNGYVMSQL